MVSPVTGLEEERRKRFMRQWDLARTTGIIQTRLSLIERGVVIPSVKEIEAIAKCLGMSTGEVQRILHKKSCDETQNLKEK
jgi:predicted transcriptional regulator